MAAHEVAEFQGLYGSYHVSELLLQKIWLRGGFDQTRARTTAGERIQILHPGSWNRVSGPDFRGARLRIGEREVTGDVEVHFHASAWAQHGHDRDPAYGQVVLHVVLFPPEAGAAAMRRTDGTPLPVLPLVDLLWHDLEEYATDEAVAALSSRDALPLVEHLLALPPAERSEQIRRAATARWREKVHYARLRIERCGWEEACHLTALEILGYRSNREGMLRAGTRHPWREWTAAAFPPAVDDLLEAGGDAWSLRGVRPANQPRLRLEQYRRWMAAVPMWPLQLRAWPLPELPHGTDDDAPVMARRRAGGLAALRERLARELTGAGPCGVRFDTLVINLVLPGIAADRPGEAELAARWWRLWSPGDIAEVVLDASRRLAEPSSRAPRTNELVQGLLGLHLRRAIHEDPAPAQA